LKRSTELANHDGDRGAGDICPGETPAAASLKFTSTDAYPKRPASLSAAECARRTGLTVRALRVYERHGLIEPARSGKGWRCYGPRELQRLNVIVTLKTFGMTLAQIRTLLVTKTPPIARILQMQLRA